MSIQLTVKQILDRLKPIQDKFGSNIGITSLEKPPEMSLYYSTKDSIQIFYQSRYMRNTYSFHRFRSLLLRFYQIYVPIEFFEGKINFDKPNSDWDDKFRNQIMISMMIDSFFSILDIFSIIVLGYYKDIKPKSIGFSYNKFLKPIKNFSEIIFYESNKLYKLLEESNIKYFRNTEKHLGFTSYDIEFNESKDHKSFSWDIKRNEPLTIDDLLSETSSMLDEFLNLLNNSTSEMCKHTLGYENPDDKILKVNDDGTYSLY